MNLATMMACATCRIALTEHNSGDTIVYRHPVSDDGHEVVPVNAGLIKGVFNSCHTCTDAPPMWNYHTGHIEILSLSSGIAADYSDQWHVCLRCAQLIEADDSDALTARCAGLMRWHPDSDEYTILRTLQRGIVLSREGRTLLTTTNWPPARISADMMPKIRDRFSGLLRGPANLPAAINDRDQRQNLARQLDLIPMYWINQEFTNLVNTVSADRPPAWVTDEIAPSTSGLLAWPQPVGQTGQLAAVSWTPEGNGWQVIGYHSIGSGMDEDLMPTLRHEIGWLAPIHAEHVTRGTGLDGSHPLGPLITTWLLINQQMAEAVPAKLSKGIVKAYQRSQRPTPEVKIVQIRTRSSTSLTQCTEPTRPRARAKPDHRFWVSGHPRQQAYGPGRSLRREIEIQPFLKGDEHLPIRLSTTVRVLGSRSATDGKLGTD
ncbi:hypothetical protein GA0070216_14411 [Micromonospora matsumotoense]|uniref:Uncharacterized protein n=1 Tax=Micromonospora matsumotoense TaxID=121616 RepID=A0A1C5AXX5_9ACTN|nr:hypothetical protein [Micromonospora matsumotoense]SCF50017.1 hypothetical protein GA0070216_14411 [Micromonospora matsumotoense]